MAHYYAFCEVHKRVGPNRSTCAEAATDGTKHLKVGGPHGLVYVKESNFKMVDGRKVFSYGKHKLKKC